MPGLVDILHPFYILSSFQVSQSVAHHQAKGDSGQEQKTKRTRTREQEQNTKAMSEKQEPDIPEAWKQGLEDRLEVNRQATVAELERVAMLQRREVELLEKEQQLELQEARTKLQLVKLQSISFNPLSFD